MNIHATINGAVGDLEVIDYSVTEDITPVAISDSSGGVGDISINVRTQREGKYPKRTSTVIDGNIILSDVDGIEGTQFKGRGSINGKVTSISEGYASTQLQADTILSRLNVTKKADPVFGSRLQGSVSGTVTNMVTNPSLEVSTSGYTTVVSTGAQTLARVNTPRVPVVGTWYGVTTWTTAATAQGGGVSFAVSGVSPQVPYFLKWSLAASIANIVRIGFTWKDSFGATIQTDYSAPYAVGDADWTLISASLVAPANASSVLIAATSYDDGTGLYVNWPLGSTLSFDAMIFSDADVPYFDGSSTNGSWSGTAGLSASTATAILPIDQGYDATLAYAFRYYLGLCGISPSNIFVDSSIEDTSVVLVGWEGQVWTYIKMLCSAYNVELSARGNEVHITPVSRRILAVENTESFTRTVDTADSNVTINITNFGTQYLQNTPIYTLESQTNVDVNERVDTVIEVDDWVKSIRHPVPLAATPKTIPAAGYYTIRDNAGLVVNPQWWTSMGGKVSIERIDWHTIVTHILGPRSSSTYTTPFSIGSGSGVAMVVTGTGVFTDQHEVTLYTGAPTGDSEEAPTVDNIFISNRDMAVDRGVHAAQLAGGPVIAITGAIPFVPGSEGQEFGFVSGTRVLYDDAWYRIRSTAISPSGITFSADSATSFTDLTVAYSITFTEFNILHPGYTFSNLTTAFPTQTFDEFNASNPTPKFSDLNDVYEGATFNTYDVYPLSIKEPVAYATS